MNDGHTVKFDRPAYNADFEIYENGYLVNGFMMSHILSFNNSKSDTANWIEDMKELEQNIEREKMKFTVKSIAVENFKGVLADKWYLFDNTDITGKNGSGKTTIATAHYWLWCGLSYDLVKNSFVRPKNVTGKITTTVTEEVDIDDETYSITKIEVSDDTGKTSHSYEIDGVPFNAKNFIEKISEIGINTTNFAEVSHPDVFVSGDKKNCRSVLFSMVKESYSDYEIAQNNPACADIVHGLKNFTSEQLSTKYKNEKKQYDNRLKEIPAQIFTLEGSMVKVEDNLDALAEEIDKATKVLAESLANDNVNSADELRDKITKLKSQRMEEYEAEKARRNKEVRRYEKEIEYFKEQFNKVIPEKIRKETFNSDIALNYKRRDSERIEKLKSDEKAIVEQTMNPEDTKCAYCGQELIGEQRENAIKTFEATKEAKLNEVQSELKRLIDAIPQYERDHNTAEKNIEQFRFELEENKKNYKIAISEAEEVNKSVVTNDVIENYTKQINETQAEIDKIAESSAEHIEKLNKLAELQKRHDYIIQQKVQLQNNANINDKIAALKIEQKETAQSIANCEKMLHELEELQKSKINVVTDVINSHFNGVRFKLFDFLKNGNWTEVCIPEVLGADGEWRDLSKVANTALQMLGKMAIVNGLQKYYNQYYPVFVDNAESIDSDNRLLIDTMLSNGTQKIVMSVTDNELKVDRR